MDVFSADGVYLGTVVRVTGLPERDVTRTSAATPNTTGSKVVFSGEALGPMPTGTLGNGGPARQTESSAYATDPSDHAHAVDHRPAQMIVFRWLVALTWSTLQPRLRRVPVSLVQNVSHEQIVLTVTAAEVR